MHDNDDQKGVEKEVQTQFANEETEPEENTKEYIQMVISAARELGPVRVIKPSLCKEFVPVSRRPNKPTSIGVYGSENHSTNAVSGFGRARLDRGSSGALSEQKLRALQTASKRVNKVVDWSQQENRTEAGSRQYLQRTVYPMLAEGLRQLAVLKPDNPLEWLGRFCLEYTDDDPEVERTELPE